MNLEVPLHNRANCFFESLVRDSRAMAEKTFRKSQTRMMSNWDNVILYNHASQNVKNP